MTSELDVERIERVAREARSFLETRWKDLPGRVEDRPPSWDACRWSALFLKEALDREIPDDEWRVAGGEPNLGADVREDMPSSGGHKRRGGDFQGHYWVTDCGWTLVVDVTADQFGDDPVIVSDDRDHTHVENYPDWLIEEHLRDVRARVDAWLDEWAVDHPAGWSEGVAPTP